MRPVKEVGKFLSDWKYVEVARYVSSLSRVIREKEKDNPLIIDYFEVANYAQKHNNIGIYTSVWLYDSKDISSCTRYSNLYFDLDSKNIEESYRDTKKLYEYLKQFIPIDRNKSILYRKKRLSY